jgi:hypothetical protein
VIITVDQALDHLRISPEGSIPDGLQSKIDQAEAMVLTYVQSSDAPTWTEQQMALLQAAVLIQLTELWRFRGDDPPDWRESSSAAGNYLSPSVRRILYPLRRPTVA